GCNAMGQCPFGCAFVAEAIINYFWDSASAPFVPLTQTGTKGSEALSQPIKNEFINYFVISFVLPLSETITFFVISINNPVSTTPTSAISCSCVATGSWISSNAQSNI